MSCNKWTGIKVGENLIIYRDEKGKLPKNYVSVLSISKNHRRLRGSFYDQSNFLVNYSPLLVLQFVFEDLLSSK